MLESDRQFKVILNPISGAGRGLQQGTALAHLLRQQGINAEVFITRQSGDAEQEASRTQIPIIVVGGDGTINEVINGLAGRKISLTAFPVGTANILAREFHLPRKPEAFLSLIQSGRTRLRDAGLLEAGQLQYNHKPDTDHKPDIGYRPDIGYNPDTAHKPDNPLPSRLQHNQVSPQTQHVSVSPQRHRRFLMLASIGLDAEVTRIIRRIRTGSIHLHSYLRPLWYAMKDYHYRPFTLVIDDQLVVTQITTAVIGNIRNYGGFFSITHKARADDGLLDICTFPGQTRQDYFRYLTGAILRRPSIFSDVAYYRGKKVEVFQTSSPVPVELDGDFWGYTPFTCTILPQSVPLLLPHE